VSSMHDALRSESSPVSGKLHQNQV
jgi:hypothetical protein